MIEKIYVAYMVAGLSRRFSESADPEHGLNYNPNKWLVELGPNNESLMEISMRQAVLGGVDEIIFIVGDHTEELFKNTFGYSFTEPTSGRTVAIKYVMQTYDKTLRDKPWGTTDAAIRVLDVLSPNDIAIICNGDDLYGEQTFNTFCDYLRVNDTDATIGFILGNVMPDDPKTEVNRAIFGVDENNNVTELYEELGISVENAQSRGRSMNDYCSMNIFALKYNTLIKLNEELDKFKAEKEGDRKSEAFIPTFVSKLCESGALKLKVLPSNSNWIGITYQQDVAEAKAKVAKQMEKFDEDLISNFAA